MSIIAEIRGLSEEISPKRDDHIPAPYTGLPGQSCILRFYLFITGEVVFLYT